MCWTQKFSFSRDPVILDLKLQLAVVSGSNKFHEFTVKLHQEFRGKFSLFVIYFPWNFHEISHRIMSSNFYKFLLYFSRRKYMYFYIELNEQIKI
jgi:hypothetical protein